VGDWNSITTNGTAQNRTPHMLPHARQPFMDRICPDLSCPSSSSSLSPHISGLLPDFDNKLKSADVDNNGSNDVTFQYDALGRRVARQGTSGSFVYVQHDQQTIADYGYGDAPSSPTHRYVYASYIDEPVVRKAAGTSGTIHYYHRNQQYSITAVTTSSGSVAERYAYTAYGQPTILDSSGSVLSSSAINNRYTYTGREWDATLGLYHFRARWISGLAGRFMGRDPIGYVDGFELYSLYFAVSNTDAMGLQSDILQPAKVPCRACCCCPDDISVEKVAADPNQGPRTNVKAAIKFSVKVRFSFVNISKQGVSNQDEITCRLRFYEYVYPGSHLVGDYQHGTWNDSVNLMRESRFFQP
jgi:RHS repeat-associated protein